jgi:hypothetical protein
MKSFRFAVGFAAMAAAASVALTACGGGGSTTSGTAAAATVSPGATSSSSFTAFQSCLKSHGVTVRTGFGSPGAHPFSTATPRPRPTGSFTRRPGAFPTSSKDAAAYKACAKYAPAGFGRGGFGGGGFRGVSASALAAFKSCMSQNGVKVTGTTVQQIFSSLRNATGKTAAADKTCRVLLQPSGTPTPSPSS